MQPTSLSHPIFITQTSHSLPCYSTPNSSLNFQTSCKPRPSDVGELGKVSLLNIEALARSRSAHFQSQGTKGTIIPTRTLTIRYSMSTLTKSNTNWILTYTQSNCTRLAWSQPYPYRHSLVLKNTNFWPQELLTVSLWVTRSILQKAQISPHSLALQ